jgi:apolipoprotein D and lipocalin family protein
MLFKGTIILVAVIVIVTVASSYAHTAELPPLRIVAHVDLSRYLGTWYEIARLPNRFQNGCLGSSAEYSLREDGDIAVLNSCRDAEDGSLRKARGHAWVVDPISNARLKVSFFWPFRGDYWIIDLDPDYRYAVVGTPSRKYLWLLSRTQTIDDELYAAIMQRSRQQGFDTKQMLKATDQVLKKGLP